jgi:hypothetical protein
MKRRSMILMAVAAMVLSGAFAAEAKKPPKDPGEPSGGYLCTELFGTPGEYTVTDTGFTFTLSGREDSRCIDVMHDTPGIWRVTVVGHGATRLVMIPRDSAGPGDSCGGVNLRKTQLRSLGASFVQELPHPSDPRHASGIPAATVNACGTNFGEWIDGQLVMEATGEPHPLAFVVNMSGYPTAELTIEVELP